MRKFLPVLFLPLIAGCTTIAPSPAASDIFTADLVRGDGSSAGVATITKRGNGVFFSLKSQATLAGTFGMHLHSIGKCEGPDFASAGGHWNPGMKQHGRDNPMGPHNGDLPNAVAGPDKKMTLEFQMPDIVLKGEGGLLDADGAALIVHEKADDYKTDPTGNSGKRMICGVFKG